ncbi:MAG: ketoacyl-ACP synthase III, partial [Acidobacteriota bacterium]|nr:ketoacyl-ACP synthase III [Acidobacteriota bacterium]
SVDCAAFDVGLGCSGYPYGLYLASTMVRGGGHERVLLLLGETPSRFPSPEDRTTSLLFGDAGSATALSAAPGAAASYFNLGTDGSGYDSLIIRGGGFRDRNPECERDRHLSMDGPALFNFTIQRVPRLIRDTLAHAGTSADEVDGFLVSQSNQFIMRYLVNKCGLPPDRVPSSLQHFGNTGGTSVPLAATTTYADVRSRRALQLMLLGYGVGFSWAAALVRLAPEAVLLHGEMPSEPG